MKQVAVEQQCVVSFGCIPRDHGPFVRQASVKVRLPRVGPDLVFPALAAFFRDVGVSGRHEGAGGERPGDLAARFLVWCAAGCAWLASTDGVPRDPVPFAGEVLFFGVDLREAGLREYQVDLLDVVATDTPGGGRHSCFPQVRTSVDCTQCDGTQVEQVRLFEEGGSVSTICNLCGGMGGVYGPWPMGGE